MKISIIIPVYNVQDYIGDCLDSILNNKYSDIEIICIDDASTDNSYSIIKQYEKKYDFIKVYKNEKNLGVSDTRNKGLNLANGDYIWFIDSDDLIDKNALCYISKYAKQNYDIICFSSIVFDKHNTYAFLDENYRKYLNTVNLQENWNAPFFLITNLWLTCIKKDFIQKYNIYFTPGSVIFEDWEFLWKLGAHNPTLYYIDKELYKYRTGYGTSLIQSYNAKNIESLFTSYINTKNYLIKNNSFDLNERFCLIRANDIFWCFLHRRYSVEQLILYVYFYSNFLNQMHFYLFKNILRIYPKKTQTVLKIIRNNPIFYIYLSVCKIDKYWYKIKKHFKRFLSPFKIILNSLSGLINILYNLLIVLFKMILFFPITLFEILKRNIK